MSENKFNNFSQSSKTETAHFMTPGAWGKSLFLPVLSTVISTAAVIYFTCSSIIGIAFYDLIFVMLSGIICGVVPAAIIIRYKIDTSGYFVAKMILFVLCIMLNGEAAIFLLWMFGAGALAVLLFGGITLTAVTLLHRTSASNYFAGKMIFIAVIVAGLAFNFSEVKYALLPIGEPLQIAVMAVLLAAEFMFAFSRKTDLKTKICLALSSMPFCYFGFLIDNWRKVSGSV